MLHSREIVLHGHIIDSGLFNRVLEMITDNDHAHYRIEDFEIGKTEVDPSRAKLIIEADTADELEGIIDELRDLGALIVDDRDARTEPAPGDGILPDDFYATTNLKTQVRVEGAWIPVALAEMDCAIVIDASGARTTAGYDVRSGERVVVGHDGVRVEAMQRPRHRAIFEFMSSTVSSEKPKESLITELAKELRATLDDGMRVLIVGGPAIVHTGAAKYLQALIAGGFVNALFAGNALATHDIEAQLFGTSLGVDLDSAFAIEGGHNHHLRTVNRMRAAGGVRAAIERGLLRSGIMYEAYTRDIPVVLAGSIRDDGPLPEVITDVVEAQRVMRKHVPEIGMAIFISTLLHSIAVGNLLPASCKVICVDINPASVTKLADRGSMQTIGLVMDAASFLRELCAALGMPVASR